MGGRLQRFTQLNAGSSAYGSSKAGLIALTKATALEVAISGITANVVAPGLVDTPIAAAFAGGWDQLQKIAANSNIANPMAKVLKPEDIAHAVAFLAHPESAVITGQVLHVNGGSLMP